MDKSAQCLAITCPCRSALSIRCALKGTVLPLLRAAFPSPSLVPLHIRFTARVFFSQTIDGVVWVSAHSLSWLPQKQKHEEREPYLPVSLPVSLLPELRWDQRPGWELEAPASQGAGAGQEGGKQLRQETEADLGGPQSRSCQQSLHLPVEYIEILQ